MITCNRCGEQVHGGSANCPNCGTPLSGGNKGELSAKKGTREQSSELPAWLESLRASDPAGTSTNNQFHFSASDIIDEGALPGWMRPENGDLSEGVSGQFPALRRASMPAPNTDSEVQPSKGFAAASLIDQQSLPSWLQENPAPEVQHGFSAASLIQPDALPDWMRNAQNAQPPFAPSSPPPPTTTPPVEPMTPIHGMSAHSLIDPQSVPAWMSGQAQVQNPGQQGPDVAAEGERIGLSASSLLDVNALPAWLREGGQVPQSQSENAWGTSNQPESNRSWQDAGAGGVPPGFAPPQNFPPSPSPAQAPYSGGNLPAGSLIDVNALPSWLRTADEQPHMGAQPSAQEHSGNRYAPGTRPAPYSASRIESVRVPGRPRTEMGPQEQSEVAASVFSSMLGVASPAPYFPQGQPGGDPGGMVSQQTFQGGQPQQPQQMYPTGMMTPMGQQGNPTGNMPPAVQHRQPGFAGPPQASGYIPGGYQGGYPMGNQPGMSTQSPHTPMGMQGNVGPTPIQADQKGNAQSTGSARSGNTAKRGIIETIRSWFSRQSQ